MMTRAWSAIVIAAVGGFILLVLAFQDVTTPSAVPWSAVDDAGGHMERAAGLVLQDERHGVLWASDGFSIYRSEGDRGFLKVHRVTPPLGLIWAASFRTLRNFLGLEETIEVFPLERDLLLVFVGGEIQRIDLKSGETEVVHRLRYYGRGEGRGVMPFGITADDQGRVYYGEYMTRRLQEGETVALFRSDDQGRNFEIVYEFPAIVVRHIHAVQWDPFDEVLWMGTGDGDEQSRVGYSKDFGETFLWVGQGSQDFRTVSFVFAEDQVAWLSDTVEVPSRALRWHRDDWEIQTSPGNLPGHGLYLRAIGGGFSLGTTAEEVVSLWLIGPELGMDEIMDWPLGKERMSGFATLRLARSHPEASDWLHFSPLRVAAKQPSIYRLSRHAAFAAAGVDLPSERHLLSRDDP
ncbi:MAG: hypothetical protein OEU92_16210 [Alphaproteobacteria bacterium]|nr:hypothetical protein [Alphaproteobacteria bacterium]